MSKLVFRELYIFSTKEKKAKKIEFKEGINIITSDKEEGSKKGKSTLSRSLYHTLGADCKFSDKFAADEKVFILHFTIDNKLYIMYRANRLFKLFDSDLKLLICTNSRKTLAVQLNKYFNFAVRLKNKNDEIEIASPAFNYILYFLDQDHYDGSNFNSFKNLSEYSNYRENVLYYHLGLIDDDYFDLEKQKHILEKENVTVQNQIDLNNSLIEKIEDQLKSIEYSIDMEALKTEIDLIGKDYEEITENLTRIKVGIIDLNNDKQDIIQSISNLKKFEKLNNKQKDKVINHECPYCHSHIDSSNKLLVEKYNEEDDIVYLLNDLTSSLEKVDVKLEKEYSEYNILLKKLNEYKEKISFNKSSVSSMVKKEGLVQLRRDVNTDKVNNLELKDSITGKIKNIKKQLTIYNNRKKSANIEYERRMKNYIIKYELKELKASKINNIKNKIELSGSNRPLITVLWYTTLLQLKDSFYPEAIKFPRVFDSPNNTEADDKTLKALLDFLLVDAKFSNQLIISTLGFEKIKNQYSKNIHIINLTNEKYNLLTIKEYKEYYSYLLRLTEIVNE